MSTYSDDIRYFQIKADANNSPAGKKRYEDLVAYIKGLLDSQRYYSAMETINDRKEIRT